MEVYQHSLTGHAHSYTQLMRSRNSVSFSLIYRSYTGTLLVSPNRRHLFVTKIRLCMVKTIPAFLPSLGGRFSAPATLADFSPLPVYGITVYRRNSSCSENQTMLGGRGVGQRG
jgi:hypothetical protein